MHCPNPHQQRMTTTICSGRAQKVKPWKANMDQDDKEILSIALISLLIFAVGFVWFIMEVIALG